MSYGDHRSVFRGNVIRVWVLISCPSVPPVICRLALALCALRRSSLLFPRVAVTRGVSSAERSLFRTIPASLPFLGCAHGIIYHSLIWNELLASIVARETSVKVRNFSSFRPRVFDFSGVHGHPIPTMLSHLDHSLFPSVDDILASFASNGPLLPRLILTGALASPIVAISLQRDTIDIGGNQGMLSIGELPTGLAMEDLTWVPLRGYTAAEGGLPAPEESPNEVHLSARIFSTLTNVKSDLPHYLGSRH
jgi:hypothetical protein